MLGRSTFDIPRMMDIRPIHSTGQTPIFESWITSSDDVTTESDVKRFAVFPQPYDRMIYDHIIELRYPSQGDVPGEYAIGMMSRKPRSSATTDEIKLREVINFIYERGAGTSNPADGWHSALMDLSRMTSEGKSIPWGMDIDAMKALEKRYEEEADKEPAIQRGVRVDIPCPDKSCGYKEVMIAFPQNRSLDEGAGFTVVCCKCEMVRTKEKGELFK